MGEVVDPSQNFVILTMLVHLIILPFSLSLLFSRDQIIIISRLFQMSLILKNKIGFIDGTIELPLIPAYYFQHGKDPICWLFL